MEKEIIKSTNAIAFKIWWSMCWRQFLISIPFSIVIFRLIYLPYSSRGTPYNSFSKLIVSSELFSLALILLLLGVFIASGVYAMHMVLNKKFKTFSIYTIENTTDNSDTTQV